MASPEAEDRFSVAPVPLFRVQQEAGGARHSPLSAANNRRVCSPLGCSQDSSPAYANLSRGFPHSSLGVQRTPQRHRRRRPYLRGADILQPIPRSVLAHLEAAPVAPMVAHGSVSARTLCVLHLPPGSG